MSENYQYAECKHCGKSVMEGEIHRCYRMLEIENSVLKQQKSEAWTTTGLMAEQKRNDLLRDENERLRKEMQRLREALEKIAHWYDDGDRYFCDSTVTGFALETLAE